MTGQCLFLIGMDVPEADPAEVAAFEEFYNQVHLPEVVSKNPGFLRGTRYQLTDPSLGGSRYLAVYEIADEMSALAHLDRSRDPANRQRFTPGPALWQRRERSWRGMYTRVGEPYERR